MSFLKNLIIVAVLAAVGYGVYVSLARNNVEPGGPPGVAADWPAMPQVDMSGATTGGAITPGSLAISGNPSQTGALSGTNPSTSAPQMPTTTLTLPAVPTTPAAPTTPATAPTALLHANPPSTPPAVGLSSSSAGPSSVAPATLVTPYPSSTSSALPPVGSLSPPPSPSATLGPPMAAELTSGAPSVGGTSLNSEPVRNLAPPPDGSSTAVAAAAPAALAAAVPAAAQPDPLLESKFAAFMAAVQKKLDEGKFAEAHQALSTLYDNSDMPAEQARQITQLLDQLAGTVIYSRQHLLEPGYVVQSGETLETVAQKYNVPWQLLAKINGLMPPDAPATDDSAANRPLPQGTVLKVVRGPFDAVVRLDRRELTLMLQNRYAGRFPIGVGGDYPKLDGTYTVCNKTLNPTYYGPDGMTIGPNDPQNPLGGAWIGLTERIGIHGTNDPQAIGRDGVRGAIAVGQRDLQDLYGILSIGSRVTIVR